MTVQEKIKALNKNANTNPEQKGKKGLNDYRKAQTTSNYNFLQFDIKY